MSDATTRLRAGRYDPTSGECRHNESHNLINCFDGRCACRLDDVNSTLDEAERLRAAIAWALGYGEFRLREDGEGAYWWRRELRERSGLTSEQLEQALPKGDRGQ